MPILLFALFLLLNLMMPSPLPAQKQSPTERYKISTLESAREAPETLTQAGIDLLEKEIRRHVPKPESAKFPVWRLNPPINESEYKYGSVIVEVQGLKGFQDWSFTIRPDGTIYLGCIIWKEKVARSNIDLRIEDTLEHERIDQVFKFHVDDPSSMYMKNPAIDMNPGNLPLPNEFLAISGKPLKWAEAQSFCTRRGGRLPCLIADGSPVSSWSSIMDESVTAVEGFGKVVPFDSEQSGPWPDLLTETYWSGTIFSDDQNYAWLITELDGHTYLTGGGIAHSVGVEYRNISDLSNFTVCVP